MKNNEQQELIKLIISHLIYFYKNDENFEVNAKIPLEQINKAQITALEQKGLTVMTIKQSGNEYVNIFNLNRFVEDSKNKEINDSIASAYKKEHFVAKNKSFIMLGSQIGSLSCVIGGALMFASSPVFGIALGAAAFGLAYYDTRKHTKNIFEKQLESSLSNAFEKSLGLENISKIRTQHYANKTEEIACTL